LILNGRNEASLSSALKELRLIHPEVYGLAGDTSQEITHKALLKLAYDHFGKVDIYINNAGIPQDHKAFIDLDSKLINKLISINVSGLLIGTKTAANSMLKQGFGLILNMEGFGSDGRTLDKLTLYGTSKRAVNYFNSSMIKELKGSCVRLGSINPGMVRTDFLNISMENTSEKEKKQFEKVKRIMAEDPETVVPVLVRRILQNKKAFARISYLSPCKLFIKIIKIIFS